MNDTPKATAKKTVSPGDELVEIELFKDNDKYKDDVYVSVNGEHVQIKRGVKVSIKRKFAEVLANSESQRRSAIKTMDGLRNNPIGSM